MSTETNLWLIRHAPVDGPRGVIHAPDAPADLGDTATIAALKARLPLGALAICSPARRTRETARALGLDANEDAAFREQDFGDWTGRRHNDLVAEPGEAYRTFWKAPAANRPPGGRTTSRFPSVPRLRCPRPRRSPSWKCRRPCCPP